MSRVSNWFGGGRDPEATSRLLVSVYFQQPASMPRRGLSRTSRRILLTTSIWSVIIIVLAFFLTYTVLLVTVDRPFLKASDSAAAFPGTGYGRPRVKFLGRNFGSKNGTSLQFAAGLNRRKRFWSPKDLDDRTSDLPDCKHGALFIIIITSSPDHFELRSEIRKTWCDTKNASADVWQCVFLVGQTLDENIRTRLKDESQRHRDILRGNYLDSYRNLTMKVMHGLAWLTTKCEAPYVLKTDDDCYVNTLLLWQFLVHHNKQTTGLYAGNMVVKTHKRKVIRDPNEKWSVSVEDYRPEYYPMYASGSGYAISFDVVTKLVEESQFIKPIPNEDAYIGIVMDRLGVQPTLSGRFTLSSTGLRVCNFKYIFVAHGVLAGVHQEMHNKMLAAQTECRKDDDVTSWY
ncbi:beta-1,3-galactosyltransferase 5-like [Littorina saxatilis]|uniref:Hexosyltransferase n=1 Tax=Littorina saxatilis TaxID=31220 RepID=A0AAN9B6F9_9CAEN